MHRDSDVVETAAQERALERLVGDGSDDVERGHELDVVALESE